MVWGHGPLPPLPSAPGHTVTQANLASNLRGTGKVMLRGWEEKQDATTTRERYSWNATIAIVVK